MTRRFWYTGDGLGGFRLTKWEGGSSHSVVTVRHADEDMLFDGVWVDGERSFDTYVIVNGLVAYHSPVSNVGGSSFELHEQRGGGHQLP